MRDSVKGYARDIWKYFGCRRLLGAWSRLILDGCSVGKRIGRWHLPKEVVFEPFRDSSHFPLTKCNKVETTGYSQTFSFLLIPDTSISCTKSYQLMSWPPSRRRPTADPMLAWAHNSTVVVFWHTKSSATCSVYGEWTVNGTAAHQVMPSVMRNNRKYK